MKQSIRIRSFHGYLLWQEQSTVIELLGFTVELMSLACAYFLSGTWMVPTLHSQTEINMYSIPLYLLCGNDPNYTTTPSKPCFLSRIHKSMCVQVPICPKWLHSSAYTKGIILLILQILVILSLTDIIKLILCLGIKSTLMGLGERRCDVLHTHARTHTHQSLGNR